MLCVLTRYNRNARQRDNNSRRCQNSQQLHRKHLGLIQRYVLLGSASTPNFDLCINLLIQNNQNNHGGETVTCSLYYFLCGRFSLISLTSHARAIISPKSTRRSTHARQNICHLLRLTIQRCLKSRCNHLEFKSSRSCQGASVVWLRGSVGDLAPLTVTLDDINSESPTGERPRTAGPGLYD